jgi:hypothetical protein
MFEIPGSNISSVFISEDVVLGKCPPKYSYSSVTDTNEREGDPLDQRNVFNASRAVNS